MSKITKDPREVARLKIRGEVHKTPENFNQKSKTNLLKNMEKAQIEINKYKKEIDKLHDEIKTLKQDIEKDNKQDKQDNKKKQPN